MPEYLVRWEIHLDADSPREAAEAARRVMVRDDSTATVFDVVERARTAEGAWTRVDLLDEE